MKYVVLVTLVFVSLLVFYMWQKPPATVFVKHNTTTTPADSLKKKKHVILKVPGSPYPIPAVK
jgi:hypothetical protein